jgi:hypothetical protein
MIVSTSCFDRGYLISLQLLLDRATAVQTVYVSSVHEHMPFVDVSRSSRLGRMQLTIP